MAEAGEFIKRKRVSAAVYVTDSAKKRRKETLCGINGE